MSFLQNLSKSNSQDPLKVNQLFSKNFPAAYQAKPVYLLKKHPIRHTQGQEKTNLYVEFQEEIQKCEHHFHSTSEYIYLVQYATTMCTWHLSTTASNSLLTLAYSTSPICLNLKPASKSALLIRTRIMSR